MEPDGSAVTEVVGGFSDAVGVNQQTAVDKVALTIESYTPDLPGKHWAVIAPFVRQAVSECEMRTPYTARSLLIPASKLAHWCWATAGLSLDRDVVFRREVIEEFIQRAPMDVSRSTRGNYRCRLLRMAEILLGPQHQVARLTPLPKGSPTSPYTPAEVVALRSWANGQRTTYRCVNCNVLLSLGLGAGLSASEILAARASHIHIDDDGVLVTVTGDRARVVPVLAEWEPALVEVSQAALRKDMFLFRPNRHGTTTNKNLIHNFVTEKAEATRVHVSSQRMRTTWIVTHLAARTPVKALIEAAGIESLEALTRFLQFVPDIDAKQARRLMRAAYRGVDSE